MMEIREKIVFGGVLQGNPNKAKGFVVMNRFKVVCLRRALEKLLLLLQVT